MEVGGISIRYWDKSGKGMIIMIKEKNKNIFSNDIISHMYILLAFAVTMICVAFGVISINRERIRRYDDMVNVGYSVFLDGEEINPNNIFIEYYNFEIVEDRQSIYLTKRSVENSVQNTKRN